MASPRGTDSGGHWDNDGVAQMNRIIRTVTLAGIAITASAAIASASSIGLDTPCAILAAAVSANDSLALVEAVKAGQRWLLANDSRHVLNNAEQLHTWTMEGVLRCSGQSPGGTLRSSMEFLYNRLAPVAADYQARQRQFSAEQQRAAKAYHDKVMKSLGQ